MGREVRYCTTEDGVRIAYSVEGSGPALIAAVGIESFALDYLFPENAAFFQRLCETFTVIRYDLRGVGLSDRYPEALDPSSLGKDLDAVAAAAGVDRLALFTYLTSGPVALEWAIHHQGLLSHLILYETLAAYSRLFSAELVQSVGELARVGSMGFVAQSFTNEPMRRQFPEQSAAVANAIADSIYGDVYARLFRSVQPLDVSANLSDLRVPTLVLNRRGDPFFAPALGQELARLIPNATFRLLDGDCNHYAVQDPDSVLEAIVALVAPESPRPSRSIGGTAFRTVLFTDLVGHTEMMSRLGDERGRAVLRDHERITREVLKTHGGTEIKTMGDGFMASFGSVTKAVECAVALQRAIEERNRGVGAKQPPTGAPNRDEVPAVASPLQVRIGLNAGEPIEEEGDLFGATVILASRLAAKAEGGEILVADTVRGLCSGKGFSFADRGEFVAKGFEEPVRVYEVRWRDA